MLPAFAPTSAFLCCFDSNLCFALASQVAAANSLYPGRASMSPLLDLLITLLHWGADGWRAQLAAREALHSHAQAALATFAAEHGERVLHTPGNPISLALTLDTLRVVTNPADSGAGDATEVESERSGTSSPDEVTFLGSMLFARCASGARVVAPGKVQRVAGVKFAGYGAHCDDYPHAYITVAAALGTTAADIDEFLRRLGACLAEHRQRRARRRGQQQGGGEHAPGAGPSAKPL